MNNVLTTDIDIANDGSDLIFIDIHRGDDIENAMIGYLSVPEALEIVDKLVRAIIKTYNTRPAD